MYVILTNKNHNKTRNANTELFNNIYNAINNLKMYFQFSNLVNKALH